MNFDKFLEKYILDLKSNEIKLVTNDFKSDDVIDVMNSSFGKNDYKPYIKSLFGILNLKNLKIFSAYKLDKNLDKAMQINILKQIKSGQFGVYSNFINRTAIYLNRLIKDNSIDVVIYPESSSNFNLDLVNRLTTINNTIKKFDAAITKTQANKIEVLDSTKEFEQKILKSLDRKIKREDKLELKSVPGKFRNLLFKFVPHIFNLNPYLKKVIHGKNILIVDDILTSGLTINLIMKELMDNKIEAKVVQIFVPITLTK